ncbi:hypothetical protein [Priestia aryabhattai]|jgi:hypothetical protein|uniref:hypothetical protein n=2 Tax=Priestia TaxID=2800373 RepID=UPI0027E54F24|nr:hypothetical protein [Priestia aryabhattai]MCG0050811.1 hypothetical protein [Priestia aryabhattai]
MNIQFKERMKRMYNQSIAKNQRHSFVVGVEYAHEDLFLELELGTFCTTPLHAQRIANSINSVILLEDHMVVIFKNAESITINDDFLKYAYKFRVCTKPKLPPLELSVLTHQEREEFIRNQAYIVTEEDMNEVNWDIKRAFQYLQQRYDARDQSYFLFSSSSSYVIPLSTHVQQEVHHAT